MVVTREALGVSCASRVVGFDLDATLVEKR